MEEKQDLMSIIPYSHPCPPLWFLLPSFQYLRENPLSSPIVLLKNLQATIANREAQS